MPAGQVDGDGFAEDFPEVWQYRVAQAEGEIEKLWAQQRMISEQLDTLATKEDLKAIEARRTRERDFWASIVPAAIAGIIVAVVTVGLGLLFRVHT